MNTRSLKFRLTLAYAGIMTAALLAAGVAGYLALNTYLVASVRDSQFRRARQMAQSLLSNGKALDSSGVREDLEHHFDPAGNNRFARVSRGDGVILYIAPEPRDKSFDPQAAPLPAWPDVLENSRIVTLGEGHPMMIASHHFSTPAGERYMVEAGAPLDSVHAALRQWTLALGIALPVLDLAAITAGFWLLGRALRPVGQMTETAERITSHNLNERLPVAATGDELEHLAVSLNRMISRLDDAFQHSRRFVADASHELRTPLTILRGELEGIVGQAALPGEIRQAAA
ncbi:MAG TPA: HAMP domain-containing protein, partial [Candidatus Limnocylindria bacterium]|nr:HAMP domain-containing protein [Candidatus Limnocylindria bacterium]